MTEFMKSFLTNDDLKETNYNLMNKDEVVASFSLQTSGEFTKICNVKAFRLPYWVKDFGRFIQHRSAPRGREHIQELLSRSGCNNLQGFLDITHALSLTDTFWVKHTDSNLSWSKVSLFRNPFNEVIAHTAFDGGMYGDNLSTPSPEYGTDGSFAKCWIREGNEIKMLKRGSSGARNAGLEPYSEYYASQVAEAFECNSIYYGLRTKNKRICSVCSCFTTEEVGFIPYTALSNESGFLEMAEKFIESGFGDSLAEMFVFDALIFNEDRHKGNFGFLFDTNTYEILEMAPLFDHNVSLLCYAEEDDFNESYLSSRLPRLGPGFIADAKLLLTPELKKRLINLKGFSFSRGEKLSLPEWRLEKLEQLIAQQINAILQ